MSCEEVWDGYILKYPDAKRWRKSPFPLYKGILYLVKGIIATGAGAFHAGTIQTQAESSPTWPNNRLVGHPTKWPQKRRQKSHYILVAYLLLSKTSSYLNSMASFNQWNGSVCVLPGPCYTTSWIMGAFRRKDEGENFTETHTRIRAIPTYPDSRVRYPRSIPAGLPAVTRR
ncbi:hypothetical protein B0H13DRAFT_1908158 [Mycena leptocephala]|nr:hypothetical protein B0H13DRAFT_1908158 [Mycena leptocephala]